MKIEKVSVYTCPQPLKIPFTHASSGYIDHLDGVYVCLEAEGVKGWGEVRGNCSYFTGDTTGAVVSSIVTTIAPKLVGLDAENLNVLHDIISRSIVGNLAAKDACDSAAYDLCGKLQNKPAWSLLGGKRHDILPSEENIPFMPVDQAEALARQILTQGSRFIKVRVGGKSLRYDIERVSAVWNVIRESGFADDVVFSVDANCAWDTRSAIRNINELAKYGVTIVEQPVRFDSVSQLRELKASIPTKLFGDESVASIEDFVRWTDLGLIDGVHIKLIKCGGITNAIRLTHLAEAHHISYMIGSMDEGMMAIAAAVAVGAVSNTDLFEVHGHVRIANDPTTGLIVRGSNVLVPNTPGLGVQVDESRLTLCAEIKES